VGCGAEVEGEAGVGAEGAEVAGVAGGDDPPIDTDPLHAVSATVSPRPIPIASPARRGTAESRPDSEFTIINSPVRHGCCRGTSCWHAEPTEARPG